MPTIARQSGERAERANRGNTLHLVDHDSSEGFATEWPVTRELEEEYALRFSKTEQYRCAVWKILTREFFNRWIAQGSTILDLGCGWGEFINQIAAARKYGMDLNPTSAQKLESDATLFSQDCAIPWPLPEAHLDVVFTSNFFEHLPTKHSLLQTLKQAFRCLAPGGRLICVGPNIKYLAGRYWDFWDHSLPLTELSLKEALELAGFEIELIRGKFLPYSMSQGFTPPLFLLRVFLRLPILWRILGKQFLIIARKPGPAAA